MNQKPSATGDVPHCGKNVEQYFGAAMTKCRVAYRSASHSRLSRSLCKLNIEDKFDDNISERLKSNFVVSLAH